MGSPGRFCFWRGCPDSLPDFQEGASCRALRLGISKGQSCRIDGGRMGYAPAIFPGMNGSGAGEFFDGILSRAYKCSRVFAKVTSGQRSATKSSRQAPSARKVRFSSASRAR